MWRFGNGSEDNRHRVRTIAGVSFTDFVGITAAPFGANFICVGAIISRGQERNLHVIAIYVYIGRCRTIPAQVNSLFCAIHAELADWENDEPIRNAA